MNWSTLEKNVLEAFDRANLDLIDHNLDDLDDSFEYLFPTPLLPLQDLDWENTNNLLVIINRG